MKAFQAIAPGSGTMTEITLPVLADDQVLIRVSYCGICGTDYDLFSGNSGFISNGQATYPIRLGHEWSGVVEKVGRSVTTLKPGDRVVGDNYVSCGVCPACQKKDYNNCTGRHHVGTINPCWPGAFAEYYIAPERHVYRLEDHVSLMEAALCEPLSVAYGGIKKMDIAADSVVVVIGTGSIGMSAAALALYKGGQVYLVGRNADKLDVALKLGIQGVINSREGDIVEQLLALTGGRLADFVLECSGADQMVNASLELAAQKAKIAMIGFYSAAKLPVDVHALVSKEITMIGIMGEYGNLEAVSRIMAEKDLHLKEIITGVVPFAECGPAFMPDKPQSVIKTIVEINKE